ncbi:hypothetical protein [Paraconexibacter sp.]|uniref:hypothetical protein n=1 Tax=Paraconexibacter sp. TaxID=2949640 RepID=UPI003561687E
MVRGARGALATAGLLGVVLLVVATFATIIEITVGGSGSITADVDRELSGYDRHSVALLLIGAAALAMLLGALRGARPAMLAVAACGVTVLLIAVLGDAPDLDDTGPIGELYEDASAKAGTGFYLETLAGALLLMAGGGLLVLAGGAAALGGRREAGTGPAQRTSEAAAAPAQPPSRPTPEPGEAAAERPRTAPEPPAGASAPRTPTTRPGAADAPARPSRPDPAAEPEAEEKSLSFEARLRRARERAMRRFD